MGGFNDVDRAVCPAPTGLDSPGFQAAMMTRMQRIAQMQNKDYVRTMMWDDVTEGLRSGRGRDGSSIARSMLEGRRQFANDEERLLYLRFLLQMELEDDNPNLSFSGSAQNSKRIAAAMFDYEVDGMKASVDLVTPLPITSYLQPAPPPGQMDVRGVTSDWGDLAARNDRSEYEAYLVEVALLQNEEETAEKKGMVYSGTYTADPYQVYVGGEYTALLAKGQEVLPGAVSLVLDFVPVAGQLKTVVEGLVGVDIITGRPLEDWERGLGMLLAIIPEARGIFKTGRTGLRMLAKGARKSGRAAEEVYRVAKAASELSEAEVKAAKVIVNGKPANPAQFEKVAGKLEEMTGSKSRGYRVAHGTIEGGRTVSKGVANSPAKKAAKAPGKVIAATKTADQVVERLTKSGIKPEAIASMERAGIKVTDDVAKVLVASDTKVGAFVNLFHECSGFELVLKDAVQTGTKKKGALFVIEFVTDKANKIDPKLAKFELPAGITKIRTAKQTKDVASRFTDLVISAGNRTINFEFKAYTKTAVAMMFQDQKKVIQFVKDVKMLGREDTRWVFDSREVSRGFVYKQFEQAIKSDAVLAREFSDAKKLEKALDDLVVMYPPERPRLGVPASAPVMAAGASEGNKNQPK